MSEIKVPKPPAKAFNPNRPASDLLRRQVEQLEWAVRHAGERRSGYRLKRVKTEADVTARIARLIAKLESAPQLPLESLEIPRDSQTKLQPTKKKARKHIRARVKTTGKSRSARLRRTTRVTAKKSKAKR